MAIQISPAILSGDILEVEKQINRFREFGFSSIQIDICDGSFSPEITITPQDLTDLDLSNIELDFHLMTEEPMDYVWELEENAGALPIKAVFGQIERMSYQEAFLEEVKKQNWQAGLAVDLFTPLESISVESWDWMDSLLLLSVEAGEQGQKFHQAVFPKILEAKGKIRENAEPVRIIVDGGINLEKVASLEKAGADQLAVGSALLRAANFEEIAKAFLAKQGSLKKE